MASYPRSRTRGGIPQTDTLGSLIYQNAVVNSENPIAASAYTPFTEMCKDEIHSNYPKEGGPFFLSRRRVSFADANGNTGYTYIRKGIRYSNYYTGTWRAIVPPTYSTLLSLEEVQENAEDYGSEAWNRFKPKLTKVGLGQFIAELRDAPGLLLKKLKGFRSLGRNYLAVEFGWKPFINDLRSWYASVKSIDGQLANLRKHNQKWLRRGGTLSESHTSSTPNMGAVIKFQPSNYATGPYYYRDEVSYDSKVWFAGCFRYFIPGLDDPKWGTARALRRLWGLNLTPSLVYELVPWSWLVDWFSSVGDVISNYDSITFDNMAAKYAYVMHYTKTTSRRTAFFRSRWSTSYPINYAYSNQKVEATVETETKARAVASPFGFNLNLPDFSAWQVSILAALGISRLRL